RSRQDVAESVQALAVRLGPIQADDRLAIDDPGERAQGAKRMDRGETNGGWKLLVLDDRHEGRPQWRHVLVIVEQQELDSVVGLPDRRAGGLIRKTAGGDRHGGARQSRDG